MLSLKTYFYFNMKYFAKKHLYTFISQLMQFSFAMTFGLTKSKVIRYIQEGHIFKILLNLNF